MSWRWTVETLSRRWRRLGDGFIAAVVRDRFQVLPKKVINVHKYCKIIPVQWTEYCFGFSSGNAGHRYFRPDDKTKENQTLTHVHRHCYHSDLALSKHSPCNPYVYPSAMRRLEEVTTKYRAFLHSRNKDGFFICTWSPPPPCLGKAYRLKIKSNPIKRT